MPNKRILWFFILIPLILSSCQSKSAGPTAWIDQPLDGSHFQIEPITVTAHASDNDGVTFFDFFLDGIQIQTMAGQGTRLSEASWEWIPAEPGVYTISVEPVDSQGNRGPAAQTIITIAGQTSESDPEEPQVTIESPVEQTPEVLPADQITAKQITAKQDLACRLGPDGLFEPVKYLLKDETAQAVGRLADRNWIQVQPNDGYAVCWIAAHLVEIDPDLIDILPDVIPPPLPVKIVTDTPTPAPADTSAPIISGLNSNPALILTQSGGCSAYSRTTTVQALISDNVNVQQATANWSIGGESGQISLTRTGGDNFEGVVGPVNTIGNLIITVQARDGAGNTSSASAPAVTVQNCIE
ncbi:MAG: hypothetical protein E4H33_01250 [Anaerolineales bacterium]|nr:MAG: hypothetical protein E4H33_01250 [Anaerolineales bacterium]